MLEMPSVADWTFSAWTSSVTIMLVPESLTCLLISSTITIFYHILVYDILVMAVGTFRF